MNRKHFTLAACALSCLAGLALDASAATIRVQCEQRGTARARVSVDGNNLAAGSYRAIVVSGANSAQSIAQAAVGDEVEFDFDSNPADIAAGATAIAPTFIQGRQVVGKIVNAQGSTVISDTVSCRVRNR